MRRAPTSRLRGVLLRLARGFRKAARDAENNNAPGAFFAWDAAEQAVRSEVLKLDRPRRRATNRTARKSR